MQLRGNQIQITGGMIFNMYPLMVVLTGTVYFLISVLQVMMLVRAIMSWFPIDEDGAFFRFINGCTEPVIAPVRTLLEKLNFFQNIPIDMSFFITFLLLSVIQLILPTI